MNELSYGEFVRNRRIRLGLSQKDVANVLNCTVQAISRYENGKVHISLCLVGSFCHVLRLNISDFFMKRDVDEAETAPVNFGKQVFSSNLIALRNEKQISVADVSDQTGISVSRLTKFESCVSLPTLDEFVEISDYFGLDYESFYLGSLVKREVPSAPVIAKSLPTEEKVSLDKNEKPFAKWRKSLVFGIVSFSVAVVFVFLSMVSFAIASDSSHDAPDSSTKDDICYESSFGSSYYESSDMEKESSSVLDSSSLDRKSDISSSSDDSFDDSSTASSFNGIYFEPIPIFSWSAPDGLVKGRDFDIHIYDFIPATETLEELEFGENMDNSLYRVVVGLTSLRNDLDLTYRVYDTRFDSENEKEPVLCDDYICYRCDSETLIKIVYAEYDDVKIENNTDCQPVITLFNPKNKKYESKEKIMRYTRIKPRISNPSDYSIKVSVYRNGFLYPSSKETIKPHEEHYFNNGIYNTTGLKIVIDKK